MMCDRVAIIANGKMQKVATVEEIIHQGAKRVEWTLEPRDVAAKIIAAEVGVSNIELIGQNKLVATLTQEQTALINQKLIQAGVPCTASTSRSIRGIVPRDYRRRFHCVTCSI